MKFIDHVGREMISRDYVEKGGGDSLTTIFGEEVMEKQPFECLVKEKRLNESCGP
jgi:hypothetical protein